MSETPSAILYEPDVRHARLIIREVGLESATGAEMPAEYRSLET